MPPSASDTELKQRHRAMWALGDYSAVAVDLIPALGPAVVEAVRPQPGETVLDIAAGTGNASLPAARTGAVVTATDLTPELLEVGRARAAQEGLDLTWQTADAEALPFADDSYDVALSTVGIMFAPHHRAAADELVRVLRPGGRLALASWTPEGFIGRMFATMKPYVAPPPAGVQPPPLWGSEEHVRDLLGDRVDDLVLERREITVDHFESGEDFRDYFKACYGPTIVAYRGLADAPDRAAELDAELADLAREHGADHGPMAWEYLLATATVRG